jgi:hypothetical protein
MVKSYIGRWNKLPEDGKPRLTQQSAAIEIHYALCVREVEQRGGLFADELP